MQDLRTQYLRSICNLQVNPVIDYKVRGLYIRPYPNHQKGCPNFGKRPTCPPLAPRIEDFFDLDRPVYCIYNVFPLAVHVLKMKRRHPDWSLRQLRNCLYWQGTARKQLRKRIEAYKAAHLGLVATMCPEAMGVNVTETMRQIGIKLEWPPEKLTHQVALAGYKKQQFR